jgi:hypothetical protein
LMGSSESIPNLIACQVANNRDSNKPTADRGGIHGGFRCLNNAMNGNRRESVAFPMALLGSGTSERKDLQSIAALQRFIDEVGLYSERAGLPLLAGRLLGLLLFIDPPMQPLTTVAAGLGTSRGSIRLAAQPLIHLGIVEMVNPPGDENEYVRLSVAGWSRMVAHQLSEVAAFGALAEHGLTLLESAAPERRERLVHVRNLYASLEQVLPELIERWEQHASGA